MATQYAFGQTVTNGLVLSLDAADKNSYIGSGTIWTDLSGNNRTGSLTNTPTFSTTNGGLFSFATNDYVNFGNVLDNDGNSAMSISLWFKTTSVVNGAQTLAGKTIIASPFTGYQFGLNTSTAAAGDIGKVGIVIVSSTTQIMRKLTTGTYNDGIWHNGVFTYDGSKTRAGMLLYIDGAQPSQGTSDSTSITNTVSNVANYQIGARDGANQPFYGDIALTMYYSRVLSANEITQNYNAQKSRFGL
jgi:hypothetical protein